MNDTKYMPKARDIYKSSNAMLWYDDEESSFELKFTDSPVKVNQDQCVDFLSSFDVRFPLRETTKVYTN